MVAVLLLPLPVPASENGTTTLTTKVPDTHSVELVIEGKGTVKVDKQEYKTDQTNAILWGVLLTVLLRQYGLKKKKTDK